MKRCASVLLIILLLLTTSTFSFDGEQYSIPDLVELVNPSVVGILGHRDTGITSSSSKLSHGSGVIIREDGYILTNYHVIEDMEPMYVVMHDGTSYDGKIHAYDRMSDLALVKIDATGLPVIRGGRYEDIRVGETVIAIGTPISFGLRNSVTRGIISGLGRSVDNDYKYLQTDAAISPGSSGGPLINLRGEMIGVNTSKMSGGGAEGLGFALPIDSVNNVIKHLFEFGVVKRASLGLELSESWAASVGLPSNQGLRVDRVISKSPAADAGILVGDMLIAINDSKTTSLIEYREILTRFMPGDNVRVSIDRNGSIMSFDFRLASIEQVQSLERISGDDLVVEANTSFTYVGGIYVEYRLVVERQGEGVTLIGYIDPSSFNYWESLDILTKYIYMEGVSGLMRQRFSYENVSVVLYLEDTFKSYPYQFSRNDITLNPDGKTYSVRSLIALSLDDLYSGYAVTIDGDLYFARP